MKFDNKTHIDFLNSLNLRYILFNGDNVIHSNKYRFKNVKKVNDLSHFLNDKDYTKIKQSILGKSETKITDISIEYSYYNISIKKVFDSELIIMIFHNNTSFHREKILKDCIFKISEASHYVDDLDELYVKIHNILSEVINTQNFYIAIADWENNLINFPYFVDSHDEKPKTKLIGNGLTEYVIKTGQSILVNPEQSDFLQLFPQELLRYP